VNALRTKLALPVLLGCQLAALFGSFGPVSWWDGV
jgi:hypothetical protein